MGCKFTNQKNYYTESSLSIVNTNQNQTPFSREVHLSYMTKFMKRKQLLQISDSLMILDDPIDQMTASIQEENQFTSATTIKNLVQSMNQSQATKDLFKSEKSIQPSMKKKKKKKRRTKVNMGMLEQEF